MPEPTNENLIPNGKGKISFDELSEEILRYFAEGDEFKWINEKYKIRDTAGDFTGIFNPDKQEFTLLELLKVYAESVKKLEAIDGKVKNIDFDTTKREIELAKRELDIIKDQIADILKKIESGVTPSPEPSPGDTYSTNRAEYVVSYNNDYITISIGTSTLKIPISMLVTEERAQQVLRKAEQARQTLSACTNALASINVINSEVATKVN